MYMKLNYTLSKTTIHKTTKNYHLHADDLLLLKIWRHIGIEKRMKSHSVPVYNCTLNMPYPADCSDYDFICFP